MSIMLLNAELAGTRRDWNKWVKLWETYWLLPRILADALMERKFDKMAQKLADAMYQSDLKDGRVFGSDLNAIIYKNVIKKEFRRRLEHATREYDIDRERQSALPRLVKELQKASDGNYLHLKRMLEKAVKSYRRFTRDKSINIPEISECPSNDVEDVLNLFNSVEIKVTDEIRTPEYYFIELAEHMEMIARQEEATPLLDDKNIVVELRNKAAKLRAQASIVDVRPRWLQNLRNFQIRQPGRGHQ